MLAYRSPNARMSLADGLAEYYREHPFLKRGDQLGADAREFFRCHDAVHVVYGCDTSLPQEAVVKLSSMFGTTEGVGVLRGYMLHESLDIYRKLRLVDILAALVPSIVAVPRTLWRCARQHKRWPWADFDGHLQTPLRDLRDHFGIRVVQASD